MSTDEEGDPGEAMDREAAEWIVRQDGADLDETDRRAFAAWLSAPGHRDAYDRHRAVWLRYQVAHGAIAANALPPYVRRRRPGYRAPRPMTRKLAAASIAASLMIACVGAIQDWPTRLRADYMTDAGERRSVTLADGSTALLDGQTALAFDQSGGRRTVRLLKGAAAFQVAPDRAHPFTVETDVGSVTALGTAFTVRRGDGTTELAVTEHSVRVRTTQGRSVIVRQGQGVAFTSNTLPAPIRIDIVAATAWTQGKLVVFDRPLGEVVARIGRQRLGYWTVRGDAAAIRVNGVYDLDHPLAALDALESSMKLNSFRLSDRVIILSR